MSAPSPPTADNGNKNSFILSAVDIAQVGENGHVILVVGPQQGKIQVSSDFLKYISPVFRAMFNSLMSEGEALRNKVDGFPVEIVLSDDNPRALVLALRALYGADVSTKTIAVEEIQQIAIFADKYDIVERLGFAAACWLNVPTSAITRAETAWTLLIAAYLLKRERAFLDTSKMLSSKWKGSLLKFALEAHDRDLGLRLAIAIEELRNYSMTKRQELGLCLDCFMHATDSFVLRQNGCKSSGMHK
ncbi:hypothetical protein FSARC_3891 [Fusarium sarcochroum]|uniref:BTB domain-containing protein n=1 Tax=Fusarium sarcochroum TaxID=1208366 RepID=A0A8H4XBB0_9HYPO|nr:hypothetical protein FSARC_3891 [Fusarium sarcochroum]